MIDFVTVDSKAIYDWLLSDLEDGLNEELYPGDERRMFTEVLVEVIISIFNTVNNAARQKLLRYATGEVLDALGERLLTVRLAPQYALTTLHFSTAVVQSRNIIIPANTKVATGNNYYFITDETATIEAGNLSVDISAHSIVGGEKYNGLLPGTISNMVDLIPDVESVTNITESSGGNDGEPYDSEGDNHYRERIRISASKMSTAGSEASYIYWAMSADPDIETVRIMSNSPGTVTIVPLMTGGVLPSQEVLDKIVETCNAKTVRPLTDLVTAEAPSVVTFDIDITYYATAETEGETVNSIESEGGAISQYINWQTSKIGRDINPDQLRRAILNAGALRVDISSPENTTVDISEIAQCSGVLNISHEVVSE